MLNSLFPLEARLELIFIETFSKIKRQIENGMTTTWLTHYIHTYIHTYIFYEAGQSLATQRAGVDLP